MSDFVPVPRPASRHCGRGGGRGRHRRGGRQSGHRGGRGRGRGFRGWGPPQRSSDNLGRGSQMDALPEVLGTPTPSDNSLCIAVQGCCHGELDAIYQQIRAHEEKSGRKIDLLLCCGDFQSLRNTADYQSLAVPPKYRRLGSFCKYYSGECLAPVLTVFIGGNHEASQPLHELYYGGWVAPNIYYLGAAGVVDVRGVRIGGIGGIYKSHDYLQGRFERPPYDRSTIRSVYHVRNVDIFRLKCLSPERSRLGMMLSHDWPQGVEQNGDTGKLLRQKPFFRDEVQRNDLGSPPNRELLDLLQPQWWFSAHLHVKFRATVRHTMADLDSRSSKSIAPARLIPSQVDSVHPPARSKDDTDTKDTKDDSTQNSSTDFVSLESSDPCAGPDLTEQMTQFMALDKCLPRRQHLSILHVPCEDMNGPAALRYDLEWLAILQKTHHLTEASRRRVYLPPGLLQVTDGEMEAIRARLSNREIDGADRDDPLIIPSNFCITVPPHDDPRWRGDPSPLNMMGNPQTDEIMAVLGIEHVITVPYLNTSAPAVDKPHIDRACVQEDENEIDLDEEEDEALGVAADRISGEIGTGPKAVDCNEGYGNVMSEDMDGGPSKMPSTC